MTMPGTIIEINIAAAPSTPTQAVQEVRAVAGRGLEGDRYYIHSGTISAADGPGEFEETEVPPTTRP